MNHIRTIICSALMMLTASLGGQAQDVRPVFIQETQSQDTLAKDTLPWPQCLQLGIDQMLEEPLMQQSQMGLKIYDLTADTTLYDWHATQTLRPASTMKLVTAITALDRLGTDYNYRTSLYYDGNIKNGFFQGDIICKGGMDPTFDDGDLTVFADRLRQLGIDTIRGRIIADVSMKDTLKWGEGWCWDDDNPTLTPLLVGKKPTFMSRFSKKLSDAGIVFMGVKTCEGRLPAKATLIVTVSHSIDHVMVQMMKESDNLYAESMFYQIAASTQTRSPGAKQAREVTNSLINRLGLRADDYKIADGSGLSLYDYLSPELEVALLRHAWNKREIYSHLLPTLPIAGMDGTLKKRMKGTWAEGNVQAKTGTVTGVSCMAGYCTAPNGHRLCFSIMNQGVLTISKARDFQDRLCMLMCTPQIQPENKNE